VHGGALKVIIDAESGRRHASIFAAKQPETGGQLSNCYHLASSAVVGQAVGPSRIGLTPNESGGALRAAAA